MWPPLAQLVLLPLLATSTPAGEHQDPEELLASAALGGLERILSFFLDNTDHLNVDACLGVAIAQGQLQALARDLPGEKWQHLVPTVVKLREVSREILRNARPDLSVNIPDLLTLLRPEVWSMPYKKQPQLSTIVTPVWVPEVSLYGDDLLDENTSDVCLSSLFEKGCEVSNTCWRAEILGQTTGYSLTHRLLFLQVARQVECSKEVGALAKTSLPSLIRQLCKQILDETQVTAKRGFPEKFRDLFLEQMALCGLEGFREFANSTWISSALSWQFESGCYGLSRDGVRVRRTKRSEHRMPGGCLAHYSGVAAAALASSVHALALADPQ